MSGQSPRNGCLGETLPSFYCWAWCYMVRNTVLVSLGQLTQLCPLPASCPPPPYLLGQRSEKQRTSWLYSHCLATAKTLVHYQHFFDHKSKTQHHMDCCPLTPSQPWPVQSSTISVLFYTAKVSQENVRQKVQLFSSIFTSKCEKCKIRFPCQVSWLLTVSRLSLSCFAFVLAELCGSPDEHPEGAHCRYGEGSPHLPSVWADSIFHDSPGLPHRACPGSVFRTTNRRLNFSC